ncbi:MAG: ATP-binding protein [bacterium]
MSQIKRLWNYLKRKIDELFNPPIEMYLKSEDVFGLQLTIYVTRVVILFWLIIRFYLFQEPMVRYNKIIFPSIFIFLGYLIILFIIRIKNEKFFHSVRFQRCQIFIDTLFFSLFYLLTENPSSDFFLFYLIPILISVNSLKFKESLYVVNSINLILIVTVSFLNFIKPNPTNLLIILIPRVFFLFFAYFILWFYRRLERFHRNRLEAIFKSIKTDTCIIRKKDWHVLFSNKKFQPDTPCYRQFHQRVEPCERCPVKVTFDEGRDAEEIIETVSKKGKKVWDLVSTPMKNERDKIVSALTIATDITERERLIKLTRDMLSSVELDEMLYIILKQINEIGYDRVQLFLLSRDRTTLKGKIQIGLDKEINFTDKVIDLRHSSYRYLQDLVMEGDYQIIKNRDETMEGDSIPDKILEILDEKEVKEWVSLPLRGKSGTLGLIVIDNKNTKNPITENDRKRLAVYANLTSHVINNAFLSERESEATKHFFAFDEMVRGIGEEIAQLDGFPTRIPSESEIDLDKILYIILTTITADTGLGFNRAILLLADEEKRYLRGKMAIGLTNDETPAVWEKIKGIDIYDYITRYDKNKDEILNSKLNKKVKELTIPIDKETIFSPDSLGREGKLIEAKEYPEVKKLLTGMEAEIFLITPLWVGNNFIGAIIADRKFTEEPITWTDIDMLLLFATEISTIIGNVRVIERLRRLNKSQSEFIRNLGHQLGTPLTNVRLCLESLLSGVAKKNTERAERDIKILNNQSVDFSRIIDNLTQGTKIEDGLFIPTKESLSISEIIAEVWNLFSFSASEKNISIQINCPSNISNIEADKLQIKDVFLNLLHNAIKYSPENTPIIVNVSQDDDKSERVEIINQGQISEIDLPHIFKKDYKRIEEKTNRRIGPVRGLAIVKYTIEQHGGIISIESPPGKGVRVNFTLPISKQPANS